MQPHTTMDKSLMEIGAQCSVTSCGLVDFLPITCLKCSKTFCSHHLPLELHKCPSLETPADDSKPFSDDSDSHYRCDFEGCRKPSLRIGTGRETCSACQKSFCVNHRHLDTHNCPSLSVAETSSSNKKFSSSLSSRPKFSPRIRKPPTDPVKLAQWQKVELMKMRHRAVPGDPKDKTASPPIEQRLHVKLFVDENQTEKIFWFRKTVVTGRALDLLVSQLNLNFTGNPALSLNKLTLSSDTESVVALRNDQLLVDQLEDGTTLVVSPAKQ